MEEAIQGLIEKNEEYVLNLIEKRNDLEKRIEFMDAHNFKEEQRIAQLEYDVINRVIYRYENYHNELKEISNNWNK